MLQLAPDLDAHAPVPRPKLHRRAFEALTSGRYENFCLFSCIANEHPAAAIAAVTLPLIAGIHASWGFSALFVVMAVAASAIFVAVLKLPRKGAIIGQSLPA